MSAVAPPPRKSRAELLTYVLQGVGSPLRESLHVEMASWLEEGKRFEAVLSGNRDKVRKKLRSAADDQALLDARAEVLVASLLSTERRFALEIEPYRTGNRGPDFGIVFRDNQRFNVEVTRLRSATARGDGNATRLMGVLLGKVSQLPASVPNVVALVGGAASPTKETVAAAVKQLKIHADRRDAVMFTRRGFDSVRAFYAHYVRLSAVAVVGGGDLWINPDARHPLPRELVIALSRCLAPA